MAEVVPLSTKPPEQTSQGRSEMAIEWERTLENDIHMSSVSVIMWTFAVWEMELCYFVPSANFVLC